jgi:hypothetical protein
MPEGGEVPVSFIIKLYPHEAREHFKITVEAERNWFTNEWRGPEIVQPARLARGAVLRGTEKMKTFVRFSLDAPDFESLRRTSQAIIKREPPLLVDSRSVGHCLRQFVERRIAIPIPHNC